MILPVNTSLGIRHLSIYLETGDKDSLTWEWIPTLLFFFSASNYIRSLKWVWMYCYVTLLLRAEYSDFFFLTYKSWSLLFTLTSKHKRPERSGFFVSFPDVSLRQNLVGIQVWAPGAVGMFPVNTGQPVGFSSVDFVSTYTQITVRSLCWSKPFCNPLQSGFRDCY